MNALPVKDMADTYIEHSMAANHFVTATGSQLKIGQFLLSAPQSDVLLCIPAQRVH